MHIIEHGNNLSNEFSTNPLAHDPPALLAYADLKVVRQFAAMTGVEGVSPTPTGVKGTLRHNAEAFAVELVVLESGEVALVCLDGPDAGERAEVSSLAELRAGLASPPLAAAAEPTGALAMAGAS